MARTAAAIRALRRLNQYKEGRTVQPGMFSTLDEAIKDAPFETNSAKGWADHLQPGRMVKRQGSEFAVKKEELIHSGLSERLSSGIFADQPITKDVLLGHLRSSRPTFKLETGREVYDNIGEHTIKIDEEEMFPRAWDETFKHSEVDPTTGAPLDMDRINVMNPRFGSEYAGSGRYHHTSPNSTYEESFTKLQGLVAPTHHTEDTLSWSRVSIHKSPYEVYGIEPRSIRLVEEIQADVHRKAAQKLWRDPRSGEHFTSREAAEAKTSWDPEDIEEVGRVGYRDENTPLEMAALKEEAAVLDAKLKKLDPLTAAGNPSRKYLTLTDDFNKAMSDLERLQMKMHDAPHKKPQDYAQLELRKQLMNAADEGDTHLALVRGRDQIERYRDIEVLSPKKQASMERMYDKIYAGELRKLAKRYGATVEDIELEVRSVKDVRTETMRDLEIEHPDEYFDDVILEMKKSKEPELVSTDIEHLADMVDEVKMSLHKELGDEFVNLESFDDMLNQLDQIKADAKRLQAQSQVRGRRAEYMNTVVAKTRAVRNEFAARFKEYQDIMGIGDPGAMRTKSFPAIVITPEVRERILEAGVAQFQRGGLVRADAMPGMEYIPSREALGSATEEELERLREINYMLSGGETAEEMNRIRELDQLYNDPQYWKDVPRHALAAMKSQWKTLDPETGESTWNFGAAPPPFEMVERGIMSLEEWKEMKEVADRVRKEKPPRPGIIDETMAMRAMMTEVANMFRDERVEPPKYAAEAMERSIALQEATEEQMGLSPAVGFPQRFSQMFGFMAGQIPSPKSLTEAAGKLITKLAPSVTKRIPKAIKVGIGAPMEFMDPTIRPALSTYLTGAAAGTGLIYGIEATAEAKLKALEEKLEEEDPEEFARGGQVSKALMKLREVGERILKERVAERKAGMEDWTRDYRKDLREVTGIEDPFTPADPGGVIMGHPRLEDYPPGYFPDDELAAEARRLYKAVEDIGPHTGGQYAGKGLIDAFPEDANLGELLDLSRRVKDVEEIEWQHSAEVGQAERKAAEIVKWGDPGELDPHAYRENQAIELTHKVIRDNEEHIMNNMREMADEANRDPRIFQQITEEDMFFDPIINAPRGGTDFDDFFGSFGNFGPEVDTIGDLWIKALGDEFKYKKIARRLKQIQEEGL